MKRLFVAIKVEPEQTLVETFERFRKWFGKENITWADAGNFHITLKFIGDTAEQEIPAIKSALKKVAVQYASFSLNIKGTGIFGSSYKPRVIWFGVEDPSTTITALSRDIVGVLEEIGIADDRQNFVPHLTMGRIKYLRFKKKLEEKINKFSEVDFQHCAVSSFYLYESELGPDGPVYHILEQYPLKGKRGTKAAMASIPWWKRLFKRA